MVCDPTWRPLLGMCHSAKYGFFAIKVPSPKDRPHSVLDRHSVNISSYIIRFLHLIIMLMNWLKTAKPPATVGLPDPRQCGTPEKAAVFQAANDAVDIVDSPEPPKKRSRGEYATYTPEIRAKIAR